MCGPVGILSGGAKEDFGDGVARFGSAIAAIGDIDKDSYNGWSMTYIMSFKFQSFSVMLICTSSAILLYIVCNFLFPLPRIIDRTEHSILLSHINVTVYSFK